MLLNVQCDQIDIQFSCQIYFKTFGENIDILPIYNELFHSPIYGDPPSGNDYSVTVDALDESLSHNYQVVNIKPARLYGQSWIIHS